MFLKRSLVAMLGLAATTLGAGAGAGAGVPRGFLPRSNDVVAFVGGADVAAAPFTAHLETLLTVRFPGARFRNFGWEGDTVFAQPREVGFPPLGEHLRRAGVTVLFVEFGRAEALNGRATGGSFSNAYDRLIGECLKQTPRVVLVTPPPFETGGGDVLPDLSRLNPRLAAHAEAVRAVAERRSLPVIDLFGEFGGVAHLEPRLTDNGLQLTARGQALVAAAFARRLGFGDLAARAGEANATGAWPNAQFEQLRQTVIEKNKLWFNYWRPQNWAFLGGDRVSQPSSRDHRDPKVRWFPAEMEKYKPLIAEKERESEAMAVQIRGGGN